MHQLQGSTLHTESIYSGQHSDLATNWTTKFGFNSNQTHPNLALVLNVRLIQREPETLSWRGRVAGTLCNHLSHQAPSSLSMAG